MNPNASPPPKHPARLLAPVSVLFILLLTLTVLLLLGGLAFVLNHPGGKTPARATPPAASTNPPVR